MEKMVVKRQAEEFKRILENVTNNVPFGLARFADGEQLFIEGKYGRGIDGWISPAELSTLGRDLMNSLKIGEKYGCQLGISDDITNPSSKLFYANLLSEIDSANITLSNIFVDGTYDQFLSCMIPALGSKKSLYLVCNKRSDIRQISCYFPNVQILYSLDDCVKRWDSARERWLNYYDSLACNCSGCIFLFAAGPLSSITIPRMWSINKNNTYIDVGSALDPILFGKPTRPYHITESADRKVLAQIEFQDDIRDTADGIGCILNCYKRHDMVDEWVTQITKQTMAVSEIHILFNTQPPANLLTRLSSDGRITNIVVSIANLGVWNRFLYAQNLQTEFVCIFDDDTIPGAKWIENCYEHMLQQEGIYGTVGLRIHDDITYMNHSRFGWPSANESREEVDLVGHSWFFKKQWLEAYWRDLPPASGFKFMGEDMHFSYAIQKYLGLQSFVPPHPASDKDLWGSIKPEKGIDANAISMTGKASRMNNAVKFHRDLGWTLIKDKADFN